MKKNIQTLVILIVFAAGMISHPQNALARENPSLQNDSVPYVTMPDVSPKLTSGDKSPAGFYVYSGSNCSRI